MIVKMKKIHLIVQEKDSKRALKNLALLGVVHVEHLEVLTGEPLSNINQNIDKINKAIQILGQISEAKPVKQEVLPREKVELTVDEILKNSEQIEKLKDNQQKRQKLIDYWKAWGDFNLGDINLIKEKGLTVSLYELLSSQMKQIPTDVLVEKISISGAIHYCLVVSRGEIILPGVVVNLPAQSLNNMIREQKEEQELIVNKENDIKAKLVYKDLLQDALLQNLDLKSFEEANAGMQKDGVLSVLKGYCPIHKESLLRDEAVKNKWGLLLEEPEATDNVPTLLQNNRFIELVKPVFDFMGIVPGYHEADVSFCFLLFFSMFFGILIGDAGYGAIFFGLTFYFHQKLKNQVTDKKPFYLVYFLSFCAIAWGLFTGTFFGASLFGKYVKPVIPWLTDERKMQFL